MRNPNRTPHDSHHVAKRCRKSLFQHGCNNVRDIAGADLATPAECRRFRRTAIYGPHPNLTETAVAAPRGVLSPHNSHLTPGG